MQLGVMGMAAISQPLATQVPLDILKQGGNAVDAAVVDEQAESMIIGRTQDR